MRALCGFGSDAIPILQRWVDSDDDQQREAILFLIERLELRAAGLDPSLATRSQHVATSIADPTAVDWRKLHDEPNFGP
jgi:hypothetical protein